VSTSDARADIIEARHEVVLREDNVDNEIEFQILADMKLEEKEDRPKVEENDAITEHQKTKAKRHSAKNPGPIDFQGPPEILKLFALESSGTMARSYSEYKSEVKSLDELLKQKPYNLTLSQVPGIFQVKRRNLDESYRRTAKGKAQLSGSPNPWNSIDMGKIRPYIFGEFIERRPVTN
jgi:DNA-directed RNA polymerase subunit H (RpoH/RPB5)